MPLDALPDRTTGRSPASQRRLNGQHHLPLRPPRTVLAVDSHHRYTSAVGASVTLVTPAIAVEPGQSVSVAVKVRNTGTVVDEFALDVLGDAAGWATVTPPSLNLFPGAEGDAQAVFAPPRAATTPAGLVPFGLRVRSREDPAGSAVEEGSVTVGVFADPHAELVPRTSRGSGSGSHDLAVDNRGNARLNAVVEASDADRQLKFDVNPPSVVVDPGMAGFSKVKVSPVKRFWRGQPKTRPFQLFVTPEGGLPITLDGTMLQESVLPPWFLKALIAVIALIVLLVFAWLFLLKPSIQSAASEAVASPLESLKADINDVLASQGLPTIGPGGGSGDQPPPTQAPPSQPTPSDSGGPPPSGGTPTPTPVGGGGVVIPGLGSPVDGSLSQGNASTAFKGTAFLTDFVFSNAAGQENGDVVVARVSGARTTPLIRLKLENFRDYDLHFVTPIVIEEGEALMYQCTLKPRCEATVLYSGYLKSTSP
jgi:hypothetical protein